MVKDLLCGIEIEETKSRATYDYEGGTYYFCALECRDQFLNLVNPQANSFEVQGRTLLFLETTEIATERHKGKVRRANPYL